MEVLAKKLEVCKKKKKKVISVNYIKVKHNKIGYAYSLQCADWVEQVFMDVLPSFVFRGKKAVKSFHTHVAIGWEGLGWNSKL